MRAYQITETLNNLDSLPGCLSDNVPDPKVTSASDVLVDVKCAGMNFFEILQVQGKYQDKPPLPFVPGSEFSGVVSKDSPIPDGCPFIPGKTRVFGSGQGSYAEKVTTKWEKLLEIPPELDFEHSAGIYVTYPTSYAALVNRANLKSGEWCLIHAAAGGVGIAAVQIAKALGARVIATASSQKKLDFVRRHGGLTNQDLTLIYDETPASGTKISGQKSKLLEWQAQILKVTKGKGVDVVYDPVGLLIKSLKVAAWKCRLVVVGFAGGSIEKVPANLLLVKNVTVLGLFWGNYYKNEPDQVPIVWEALLSLIKQGRIRPVLHPKIYNGLEKLPEGLNDLANRKVLAKAIIRIHANPKSNL
ncbi:hypothetical protein BY996DRAFT_7598053 [Phakopsora pachyrhizi]|uniref:Enoyl reductase (ER) domain-containing protein n=1 Tax=Phakopsora pachyrhizi TaxID=170000 RepID=A0AAV0APM8_PHAPC|nr:hypothetical protein BY996DRAFT_7598053 [Phakopsora pachyrhizi]CAH7670116.1 hypothetical protein PPACK8108_LOCUS4805 [Phakopsora pachyrhizi]